MRSSERFSIYGGLVLLFNQHQHFFYLENIDLAIRAAPKTKHKMFLTFIFIIRSANVSVNLQMSHVIRVCTS